MSTESSISLEHISRTEVAKKTTISMTRIVIYIVLYIVVAAILQWFSSSFLPPLGINITEYMGYVHVLLALAFGYLIVNSVGIFFYWSLRSKYDHATAAAVRNLVKIIGIGALVASIAGGVAGGAAGVALGGFLGIVIGFASQQVLGQAIAGFFLLITRPYKIGELVVLGGEEGVVDEVSTLFTVVIKSDGTKVLIPNNSIVGSKIYLKQKT